MPQFRSTRNFLQLPKPKDEGTVLRIVVSIGPNVNTQNLLTLQAGMLSVVSSSSSLPVVSHSLIYFGILFLALPFTTFFLLY